jgi:hypothetical protein
MAESRDTGSIDQTSGTVWGKRNRSDWRASGRPLPDGLNPRQTLHAKIYADELCRDTCGLLING